MGLSYAEDHVILSQGGEGTMSSILEAQPEETSDLRQWFVAIDDIDVGPIDISDVESRWRVGEIKPSSLMWRPGMPDWQPVSGLLELRYLFEQIPQMETRRIRATSYFSIRKFAIFALSLCTILALLVSPGASARAADGTPVIASAVIVPAQVSEVGFLTTALVREIPVKQGDTVQAGQTLAVANPFADGGNPAAALAATAATGDLLHLWTGSAFNSYPWQAGAWTIADTTSPLPAARLDTTPGSGCLITRQNPEPWMIAFAGSLRTAASTAVPVPAASWRLIACPYPVALTPALLLTAGTATGDALKTWDRDAQAWVSFSCVNGAWSGPAVDTLTLPAGTAFLFYNAQSTEKALTFSRPP